MLDMLETQLASLKSLNLRIVLSHFNKSGNRFCISTAFLDSVRTVKWNSNSYVHEDKHQSVQSKNIAWPYAGKKESKICLGTEREWY